MRPQIIVWFVALFWLALTPAAAVERGALFKIKSNGHTMHLFGIIHVGVSQFYPLEPVITGARIAADTSLSGRFAREVLLDGRNGALAGKLGQLLADEENTVAAIGVLHLLGKNSVPELLRARGIEVERVY
jgi:uncharacterized protein YbaP (TraB family)